MIAAKNNDNDQTDAQGARHPAELLGVDPFEFCSSFRRVRASHRHHHTTLVERVITFVDRYQQSVTE